MNLTPVYKYFDFLPISVDFWLLKKHFGLFHRILACWCDLSLDWVGAISLREHCFWHHLEFRGWRWRVLIETSHRFQSSFKTASVPTLPIYTTRFNLRNAKSSIFSALLVCETHFWFSKPPFVLGQPVISRSPTSRHSILIWSILRVRSSRCTHILDSTPTIYIHDGISKIISHSPLEHLWKVTKGWNHSCRILRSPVEWAIEHAQT